MIPMDPHPIPGKEPVYPNASNENAPLYGKRIFFSHIPKCAGNSVFRAVREAMGAYNRVQIPVGPSIDAAHQIREGMSWLEYQEYYLECRQYLLQMYMNEGWNMIGGHLPFSPVAWKYFHEKYAFITVLRDPVERFKSNMTYLVMTYGKHGIEAYNEGKANPVDELRGYFHNEMPEFVAKEYSIYLGGLNEQNKGSMKGAKARAIEHLKRFDLIGFLHHMKGFERNFEIRFGIPLELKRFNDSKEFIYSDELRDTFAHYYDEIGDKIREMCADDIEIYQAALTLSAS